MPLPPAIADRRRVAELRAEGLSQRAIARRLGISQDTVMRDSKLLRPVRSQAQGERAAIVADARKRLPELGRRCRGGAERRSR